MRFRPGSRRLATAFLAGAVLALGLWIPAPAGAASADLFFSEYVEGGGNGFNNRALEIYNGTGAPVNLSAGGYRVEMYLNGRDSANMFPLIGTVAPGDVFVFASSFAHPDILAQADQLSSIMPFSGNDAVVLRHGVFVIDSVGQVGVDPGVEWGSGSVTTADHTLRRKWSVQAGDTNPYDAYDPAAEWDGFPMDTFDGLGAHGPSCEENPPSLSVFLSHEVLWPPNHKSVAVEALVVATDDTDPAPAVSLVSVTSNEPDDGDVVVFDQDSFGLRADRWARGSGRVYTVTYRAEDACGNSAEASASVLVPLNNGS